MTKIKICGLKRECDIDYVNAARPDYIGFVFAGEKRRVSIEQAANLRSRLDEGIIPVGVFVNAPVEMIVQALEENAIEVVQLHGSEDEEYIAKLRQYTQAPIIKAVSVTSVDDVIKAQDYPVDYLLFDQGKGGTGKTFDWSLLPENQMLEEKDSVKPFFLAGGISPENAMQAVRQVQPYAIDVSSGVETNGFKDADKIQKIVQMIRTQV